MQNRDKFNRSSIITILFCIMLFLAHPMSLVFSQKVDKNAPGFPFHIEKPENTANKLQLGERIHIFLEEKYFNRENLRKLFAHLSKPYPDRPVGITLFTDKEMLLKQIRFEKMGIHDLTANTPARKKFFDEYMPPETGYFRAFYYSNSSNVHFNYSPKKDSGHLITVTEKDDKEFVNSEAFLFASVTAGYVDAVKWVLNQKPKLNLDISDKNGSTPLSWAVWLYHNEIAEAVISAGADVNYPTTSGSALFAAIDAANYEGVKLLIANKASVNFADSYGKTPLMGSALYCNFAITKLLLENGANKEAKDNDGKTVSDYSCRNKEIMDLFSTFKSPIIEPR